MSTAPRQDALDAQRALLNILEDIQSEKGRLVETQRAALNIVEDFTAEKAQLGGIQRAVVNMLEDFEGEQQRLEGTQRAALNILEDFTVEKTQLAGTQRAALNILEDFTAEKTQLASTQQAVLNILDDSEGQRTQVEGANVKLQEEIGERQKAEAGLHSVNQELEAFTYSVAHDLRTPLRHIRAYGERLQGFTRGTLPEKGEEALQKILDGAARLDTLVEDLLGLARVGRQEMRLRATGLDSLVAPVVNELKLELEGRQVEWRLGRLPQVECDPTLMALVFQNLLANAVKFTRPRAPAVIEVGSREDNGLSVVFVRDNGVGFNMKYADKLFGLFQRLHRRDEFEGTGVGLATVQRIVHRHGGRVWAEAELDKGATFYFTLGAGTAAAAGEGGET